jgi:hypothetical protein
MVPSTLRVYLSRTTPTEVKSRILERLEKGERVSRKHLHSAVAAERSKAAIVSAPARNGSEFARLPMPDLLVAGEISTDLHGDRSRQVADLLLSRLSREDYESMMQGMTWGVWNRVFVWMRAARRPLNPAEPATACTSSTPSLRTATSDA